MNKERVGTLSLNVQLPYFSKSFRMSGLLASIAMFPMNKLMLVFVLDL